ncbi:MAG TPA: hypothetical protein VFE77_14540 [Rhodanobacter sp.]|nr:hypothetical protein [Rhodanobacter sp.]
MLDFVHGLVGAIKQVVEGRHCAWRGQDDTRTERDFAALRTGAVQRFTQACNAVADNRAISVEGARQHHEFITAQPRQDIGGTKGCTQQCSRFDQQRVARFVTSLIIERLESVDVDIDQRKRMLVSLRPAKFRLGHAQESTSVEQAGEHVRGRFFKQRANLRAGMLKLGAQAFVFHGQMGGSTR